MQPAVCADSRVCLGSKALGWHVLGLGFLMQGGGFFLFACHGSVAAVFMSAHALRMLLRQAEL